MKWTRWGGPSERGAAAVELAIIVPGLMIMLALMMAGGRVWFARASVTDAAFAAARTASISRTAGQAAQDGAAAARQSLATSGFGCAGSTVSVDTSGFTTPVGQPATVTSRVACTVTFSDLLLPGMPGSLELSGRAASALDTYRERR